MKGSLLKIILALALLTAGAAGNAGAEGPSATMKAWSPSQPVIPVGTVVTFHAAGADPSGVVGFEWDFDGDEEPDAQSVADAAGAKSSAGSVQFKFEKPATLIPAVRAVNAEGFVSPWDTLDQTGGPAPLVIGSSAPPKVTMNQWSPYSAKGPDGQPDTLFVFSASASSAAGIARIEWDFDGNGIVDSTTPVAGSPASVIDARTEHAFKSAGSWAPRARAVDSAGLASAWEGYRDGKNTATLDVANAKLQIALQFAQTSTAKTLPATFSFTVISSGKPARLEWDFDGDGKADQVTAAPSAKFTYAKYGQYLPSVTVIDATGSKVTAVPLASGQPAFITILPPTPAATMSRWSPYSAAGADGGAGTEFSFTAGSQSPGVQKFEWDFDGDGIVDATTVASGSTAKATHTYGRPGTFAPKVRVVDSFGQASPWASPGAGSRPDQLDVSGPSAPETFCDGKTIQQLIASGQYKVFDGRAGQKRALTGTAGKDLLIAGTSSSVLRGLGGSDCIIGGPGNDVISGGDGDDQIFGRSGKDRIDGGSGSDLCTGVNCERR